MRDDRPTPPRRARQPRAPGPRARGPFALRPGTRGQRRVIRALRLLRMLLRGFGAAVLLAIALAAPQAGRLAAQDCAGAEACSLPGGTYFAEAPPDGVARGAVMFLHGYGGSGAGEIGNRAMVEAVTAQGYAFVAPDGMPRPGGGQGNSWNAQADPAGRDDIAFLDAVAQDAAARFGFPRERVLAAGFSGGAMMVWRLACDRPERFAAYAPVAGLLWRPLPGRCAGPVRLLHTHGWADPVVPLEGRAVAGGALVQGDLFAGLALLRRASGCTADAPDREGYTDEGGFLGRRWSACAPGAALELLLHGGGHAVPAGWAPRALAWFGKQTPAE
ncbi:PHB depolymerase family esterase [Oceanicella sp. SM1341]|uniref:alpha/beta hydrolase family esterase n=1 Tax=Oceanicella sp. SM1341 TaxID=1548889 RepID=UPI001E50E14A|nr:alpha/beta fold hydrolase [Oceanicella sp. SM1341]